MEDNIDGGLLPAFIPEAVIVMTAQKKKDSDKYDIKVRLGNAAPNTLRINKLGLPDFGGRWNAGNTKRHGGTKISPEEYARLINEKVNSNFLE